MAVEKLDWCLVKLATLLYIYINVWEIAQEVNKMIVIDVIIKPQ